MKVFITELGPDADGDDLRSILVSHQRPGGVISLLEVGTVCEVDGEWLAYPNWTAPEDTEDRYFGDLHSAALWLATEAGFPAEELAIG